MVRWCWTHYKAILGWRGRVGGLAVPPVGPSPDKSRPRPLLTLIVSSSEGSSSPCDRPMYRRAARGAGGGRGLYLRTMVYRGRVLPRGALPPGVAPIHAARRQSICSCATQATGSARAWAWDMAMGGGRRRPAHVRCVQAFFRARLHV